MNGAGTQSKSPMATLRSCILKSLFKKHVKDPAKSLLGSGINEDEVEKRREYA